MIKVNEKKIEKMVASVIKQYIKEINFDLEEWEETESEIEAIIEDNIGDCINYKGNEDGEMTEEEEKEFNILLKETCKSAMKKAGEIRREYAKRLRALQAEMLKNL